VGRWRDIEGVTIDLDDAGLGLQADESARDLVVATADPDEVDPVDRAGRRTVPNCYAPRRGDLWGVDERNRFVGAGLEDPLQDREGEKARVVSGELPLVFDVVAGGKALGVDQAREESTEVLPHGQIRPRGVVSLLGLDVHSEGHELTGQ